MYETHRGTKLSSKSRSGGGELEERPSPPPPVGMGGASMTAVKPSVLVIDDEKRMRKFVRASLGRTGYHVIEASNAADGLRHAQTAQPDVVLVDLDLPDIDGFEFTR